MGYERQHAILVSASYDVRLKDVPDPNVTPDVDGMPWAEYARFKAVEIFGEDQVSPVLAGVMNGVASFFVAPDGSKEGWPQSDEGDQKRARFVEWMRACAYEDGSSPLDYAEVQYGDDDCEARIVNSGDDDYKAAHPEWFKEVAS